MSNVNNQQICRHGFPFCRCCTLPTCLRTQSTSRPRSCRAEGVTTNCSSLRVLMFDCVECVVFIYVVCCILCIAICSAFGCVEMKYVDLHFNNNYSWCTGNTPPTNQFWSLTMYSDQGYLVPNQNGTYSVSSQQPLKFRADGSLHVTISMQQPDSVGDTNWLPAPQAGEDFQLTLR